MKKQSHSVSASVSEQTLCLTLNRSSQQAHSGASKSLLRGRLFSIRSRPSRFCKQKRLALLNLKGGQIKQVTYLSLPCNSWSCPNCALAKGRRTQSLLKEIIILNKMKYFLTLTLDPKSIPMKYINDGNQTHKYITKLFNTFTTNIRRDNKNFRYVWVIEFQKSGFAHLHVAINTRLNINTVRTHWTSIGGGVQMHISKVRNLISVATYISKYLTKSIVGSVGYLHHFERRYSVSTKCIRPTSKKAKPYHPDLSNTQIRTLLHNQNLSWVYNRLLIGDFVEGESIQTTSTPV